MQATEPMQDPDTGTSDNQAISNEPKTDIPLSYKVVSFKPNRLSGWCIEGDRRSGPTHLQLCVDGKMVGKVICNRFRNELSKSQFKNRKVGFIDAVPFPFWDGEVHRISLVAPQSGTILREALMAMPDATIAPELGLYGQVQSAPDAFVAGWVHQLGPAAETSPKGPLQLSCQLDGEEIARGAATLTSGPGGASMFRFALPPSRFDDESHEIELTALLPEGPVSMGRFSRRLAKEHRPKVSATLDPIKPGHLSGIALHPLQADIPLHLTLIIAETPRLHAVTAPKDGGRFDFDLAEVGPLHLAQDDIRIEARDFGTVEGVPANLLRSTACFYLDDPASLTVCLTAIAPFTEVGTVQTETLAGRKEAPQPLAFEIGASSYTAHATLTRMPESETELRLGDQGLLMQLGAPVGPSLSSARNSVSGQSLPPSSPETTAALNHLRHGDTAWHTEDAPQSAISGGWTLEPSGLLRGWVVNLDQPEHHFPLSLHIDGASNEALVSGRNVPLTDPVAAAHQLPLGFFVDLATLDLSPGSHRISLHVADSETALPDHTGQKEVTWTAPEAYPERLSALLPPGVDRDQSEFTLTILRRNLASPADDRTRRALLEVFQGRVPSESDITTHAGTPLSTLLLAQLRDAARPGGLLDRLETPFDPLPHHQGLPPIMGVDLSALLERLALPGHTPATPGHEGWRGFLLNFLSGMAWPTLLLDRTLPEDSQILLRLARFGATTIELPTMQQDRRYLFDKNGGPAAHEGPQVFALQHGPEGWQIVPARSSAEVSQDTASPETDFRLRVLTAEVAGCIVRVTCAGQPFAAPPLSLLIGETACELIPSDETAEDGTLLYWSAPDVAFPEAPLPLAKAPSAQLSYDIRIGSPTGPRPEGLPAKLFWRAGQTGIAEISLTGMTLSATVRSEDRGTRQLVLRRTVKEADPEGVMQERHDVLLTQTYTTPTPPDGKAFQIDLPDAVLDGSPQRLSLVLTDPTEIDDIDSPSIWEASFAATTDLLYANVTGLTEEKARKALLLQLARLGRVDVIQRFLDAPGTYSPALLKSEHIFEILITLMPRLATPQSAASEGELLSTLWSYGFGKIQNRRQLQTLARRSLMALENGNIRNRYPLSPISEAVADLLLTTHPDKPEEAAKQVSDALSVRRPALARVLLDRFQARFENNPDLYIQRARLDVHCADYTAAEAALMTALRLKPNHKAALAQLAQLRTRQDRPLEAAALLTSGRGLSIWQDKPVSYDYLKILAPLDWVGLMQEGLQAANRPELLADTDRQQATSGTPPALSEEGYSLFYLTIPAPRPDLHAQFQTLMPTGCTQVAFPDSGTVPELECTGEWAFVFHRHRPVTARFVEMIHAQKRPQESILRLVGCTMDEHGLPGQFETVGAVIRSDILRLFGPLDLDSFLDRAETVLRVKTLLI